MQSSRCKLPITRTIGLSAGTITGMLLRLSSRRGALLTSGPRVYDLCSAAPRHAGGRHSVPKEERARAPFSACTPLCLGFSPLSLVRLQVPSLGLHWPWPQQSDLQLQLKGCEGHRMGGNCLSLELERSTCNSRFSILGVTTHHHTLLMLRECS